MKIKIIESVSGLSYDYACGQVVTVGKEISERIAADLLNGRIAELVPEEVEAAVVAPPEVAVSRGRGRPRGSRNRPEPDAS